MRHEWELAFACSGHEALGMMAEGPFDVVVSDIRMPGMSGVELLTEVRSSYPQTARIALSGQTKKEDILGCVGPVHQYLSKPCDPLGLRATIGRTLALRNLLLDDRLRELVSRVQSLPSQPTSYKRLLDELTSPEASLDAIESIISKDVAMSAKILQLVNSAFFGVRHHVSSPRQAVALLGLDTVKALVISAHIFTAFEGIACDGLSLEALWSHSASTAALARRIANAEDVEPKTADYTFIAGLLHDVGKLALAAEQRERYAQVLAAWAEQKTRQSETERSILGATHAEVGAYLLGLWGFSDPIVEAVAFHDSPRSAPSRDFGSLTAVHVASAFAAELCDGDTSSSTEVDETYLEELGLRERLILWRKLCLEVVQAAEGEDR